MKDKYSKPEIEIIQISVETAIMAASNSIGITDDLHDGPANSKKRSGFWD